MIISVERISRWVRAQASPGRMGELSCPSGCWTYCRCPAPQELIAGDARRIALYPGMSMMMVYRDLISLKQVPGVHMMQALILASPAARITNLDFPRGPLPDSREMARHLRARFVDEQGKSWIYSCKMGTTLAHLPKGRRVFVKPQWALRFQ